MKVIHSFGGPCVTLSRGACGGQQVANPVDTMEPIKCLKALELLTPRQKQVLILIGECKPQKEIASELQISIKTVERHCEALYRTLNIHSVAEAVRIACKSGLV